MIHVHKLKSWLILFPLLGLLQLLHVQQGVKVDGLLDLIVRLALCHCTVEILSSRRRPFLRNRQRNDCQIWGTGTCPHIFRTFFSHFLFLFLYDVLYFVNMGPYRRDSFKRDLLGNKHQIHSPNSIYIKKN